MFPCPKCGSSNYVGQQFCVHCGQKLQYSCPQCGAAIEPLSSVCTSCGTRLNWSIPQEEYSAKSETQERDKKSIEKPLEAGRRKKGSSPLIKIAVVVIVVLIVLAGALFVINEFSLMEPVDVPQDEQEAPPPDTTEHMVSPVVVSFDIAPTQITAVESATLKWEVTDAVQVTIDQSIGEVPLKGSRSVSPATSTVYELIATNEAGSTSRTATITVFENVNASKIALTIEDVEQSDFIFDMHSEPSIDDTISTYYIRFKRYGQILDNTVSIHTTVEEAENRYDDIKYNNRQEVTDVVTIGERGYVLTYITGDSLEEYYDINFHKHNVYVNIGGISDFDELVSLAEIIEARIK